MILRAAGPVICHEEDGMRGDVTACNNITELEMALRGLP
jgi:hypothetical protein